MDYAKKLKPIKGHQVEKLTLMDLEHIKDDMKLKDPSFQYEINPKLDLEIELKKIIRNYYLNQPSVDDLKGLWHRPFETDLKAVQKTLDELKSFHINHLFVETYFNGRLILPSKNAKERMHSFVGNYGIYGNNLLKAFVEEGRKRAIKIHAWVENFFIGQYKDEKNIPFDIYDASWFLINRDQTILQKNEVNYVFLDPANPEVRSYVLSLYKDILSIDGLESLHLDYIRYPLCYDIDYKSLSDDTGYTEYAIKDFMKTYHYQGDIYELLKHDENVYFNFKTYKTQIINQFVKDIKMIAHRVMLSTAVFGDPKHAQDHKMQDWSSWIKEHMIDIVLPMAYYKDADRVFEEIKNMKKIIGNECLILAGLAPSYIGLDTYSNLTQIDMARRAGADGVCLFATQNYLEKHFMGESESNQKTIKLLEETVFKI